jgi:Na+/H+-translocating membrane pyrophosphatase
VNRCHNIQQRFESIAGYGLGGSTIALFAYVGAGIGIKTTDVGADLVEKSHKTSLKTLQRIQQPSLIV